MKLFEHQLQAAQFMYDQETLDGGVMQHLWAELPPHPQAPAVRNERAAFSLTFVENETPWGGLPCPSLKTILNDKTSSVSSFFCAPHTISS